MNDHDLTLTHFSILALISSISGSRKQLFHMLEYHQNSLSLVLMASQKFIEFIGSATLSNWPWIITSGHVSSLLQVLSSFFSITSIICVRVPTHTLPWQTSGSFRRQVVVAGLRHTLSKVRANIPALLGISLRAKSETAERTLLLAGFFKAGAPRIRPANLYSLNYLKKIIESKEPSPCPIRKTGTLGYVLNMIPMKVLASFITSLESSRQPRSPSDFPWPLWSQPTKVQPLLAMNLAVLATSPMWQQMLWKKIITPLVFSAGYRQVANFIWALPWVEANGTKFMSGNLASSGRGVGSDCFFY